MPLKRLAFLVALAACSVLRAQEPSSTDTIRVEASATNTSSNFNKYLFTFPLPGPVMLTGLSGSVVIRSHGQNFGEALFGVKWIAPGTPYPHDGEVFANYPDLTRHYPDLHHIVNLIVKEPSGVLQSTLPVDLKLPAGIPMAGRLLVILDGSVLKTGGDFTMSTHLVAHLALPSAKARPGQGVDLGDEYCFAQGWGGELATLSTSPQAAFIRVTPVEQEGKLLALYGDVSDSTFGPAFNGPAGSGPWALSNDYYVYRHCVLPGGSAGPADYYAMIPPDATQLASLKLTGHGQAALQQTLYQAVAGITLHRGDALVHLVRMTGASDQGGIDAESQMSALVRPPTAPAGK